MKLDLGSGPNPFDGFVGVDRAEFPGVECFDLASGERWPWEDDSIDALRSSHFIEHIPALDIPRQFGPVDSLFFFFDEAYRVAKPGARFELIWPAMKSDYAFQDPTHRRFLPLAFVGYLSRESRETLRVGFYGVQCDWRIVEAESRGVMRDGVPPRPAGMSLEWALAHAWGEAIEHRVLLEKPGGMQRESNQ